MSGTHVFSIPIGDWSDDGHGKCEYFHASAAKPFKDVCKAFKAAKKKFKKDGDGFTPEELCSEYEDSHVPDDVVELLEERGFKIDPDDFGPREFAELVVWYLNQGDPDLNAELLPEEKEPPMLRNWDYRREVKEDLGGFGYGLFGC